MVKDRQFGQILAIDLAWSGPTGWCIWDEDDPTDPIKDYGVIKHTIPKSARDFERTFIIASGLTRQLSTIINATRHSITLVACEISDWHFGSQDAKLVGRDRTVLRALGRAECAFAVAIGNSFIDPSVVMMLGANEARKEFGAHGKADAAGAFAAEFPRFRHQPSDKKNFLYDTSLKRPVSHDVSDSFVIGMVAGKRMVQATRIVQ